MGCHSNQEQEMAFINHHPPEEEEEEEGEEELLLLQQTTSSLDSPFSHVNHLGCTNCGYHKRPSPEPTSQQPRHKKPNNHHLPSLNGFSKIPLPNQDQPLLRRCSDPINPPAPQDPPQSPPQSAELPRPETPLSAARASAAKLPPRAPALRRSVSDPNPSPSNTTGGYESPNDKRLRRMRDCIREMNKWWDEILPEEQQAAINNNNSATMENSDEDIEESVSVERAGEFLIIHFKCPCKKGYQILISGKNCYYKLM